MSERKSCSAKKEERNNGKKDKGRWDFFLIGI